MDSSVQMQNKIRMQCEDLKNNLCDMKNWEQEMREKEKNSKNLNLHVSFIFHLFLVHMLSLFGIWINEWSWHDLPTQKWLQLKSGFSELTKKYSDHKH